MSKYYIVGSGITGCVLAHELAENNHEVVIWERRNHLGGNIYDYIDEHGIRVSLYGPHIFHTKSERVWNYIRKFSEFTEFHIVCGSVINGKCVPTDFDFQSIDEFFPDEAEIIKEHIKSVYGDAEKATILEMLDCKDEYVVKYAKFLYDNDYAPYTAKQWGISPEEVDREIFKRVPVLLKYGAKYFDDPYQAMPTEGFSKLIERLLDNNNITVRMNEDAFKHLKIKNERIELDGKPVDGKVIYTGPLDELFECKFGRLPYRSLRFEWKYEDIDSFQKMPVVAYPQAKGYTRITEYKKLPIQDIKGTTYAIEYPIPYDGTKHEPYYPILTEDSKVLVEKYKELADRVEGLVYCGRLAEFKYYNMDQAILAALKLADRIIEEVNNG